MITFVGIVGKRDKPLYLKTYDGSSYTESQLIENAFTSLDVFDERLRRGQRTDFQFGMLASLTSAALYGFMTNTQIKIMYARLILHAQLACERV